MIRKLLLTISLFIFLPSLSSAAVLYLEPEEGDYYRGDTFIVNLRVDTENECINTIEANLSFSQNVLEVIDFSNGDSILNLWVSPPYVNQESGLISFAGGIPGGFCGPLPGDPGESNLLGKIIFKVKESGGERFSAQTKFLDNSQVFLNDGFGTPAKLSTKRAVFSIFPGTPGTSKREWLEELEQDKIPPEPFEIGISQDPLIFEGKHFIAFSTTDKQTGIDYYEVKEGKKDWQRFVSPYLLEDQSLESIIKVKAVDKAGNERIAQYPSLGTPLLYWIIVLVLMGIGLTYWVIKRLKIKR